MKDLTPCREPVEWLGHRFHALISAQDSGGAISVIETVSAPGYSPPRHIHHDADEAFVLISGDLEFWVDGTRFTRVAGQSAFVPRGASHSFRVIGDIPSRHLAIFTPGGFESFFAEMAAGQCRIPEDMAEIEAAAARHNLSFTGPPLEAA